MFFALGEGVVGARDISASIFTIVTVCLGSGGGGGISQPEFLVCVWGWGAEIFQPIVSPI